MLVSDNQSYSLIRSGKLLPPIYTYTCLLLFLKKYLILIKRILYIVTSFHRVRIKKRAKVSTWPFSFQKLSDRFLPPVSLPIR
jgi:hypothetical protein